MSKNSKGKNYSPNREGTDPKTHNTGDENEVSSDDDCRGCGGTGEAPGTEGDCKLCDGKGR